MAVAGSLCTLLLASCAFFDPRSVLDPRTGFSGYVYLLHPEEEPVDVTERVCRNLEGCERAAESQRVRIVRFNSAENAQAVKRLIGAAGYQSDRFVIEFLDASISDEQRRLIESTVDHTATWDA